MKLKNFLISSMLILSLVLFIGCTSDGSSKASNVPDATKGEPQWWLNMKGPAYQVLVYSFADSDGDGYGDFQGLISKLDYLNDGNPETTTDLGVELLWLSPIHPAASYHGYDVKDYMAVNPQYGTMADFEQLILECANRNIKVILDLVFNHSSTSHPWFEAMLTDPTSKYYNYYIHKDESINYGTGGMGSFHPAYGENGKVEYFGAFSPTMPDLNCANPAVKKEFVKIMKFWLEKGVAGFRFDAAKHIFDQNELPNGTANMALNKDFWVELRKAAQKIKPNVFFIGEVLNKSIPSIGPYAPGFDSLWDFATEDILAASVGSGSTASLLKTLKRNIDGLTKYDDFVPSYLLSNHDMDRSISTILNKCGVNTTDGLGISPEDPAETVQAKKLALTRAKTAASLYHTLPGLPWVYYGEELGITGIRYANNDISRRDSMIWTKDRKLSPKWQNKIQMVNGQNRLTPSVEEQSADPNSLLNHYRNLSALRASSEAIRKGSYKASTWPGYGGASMMAYFRELEKADGTKETVFVVHSTSDIQETRAVPANVTATLLWSSVPGKTASDEKLTSIVLEPGESAVFNVIE